MQSTSSEPHAQELSRVGGCPTQVDSLHIRVDKAVGVRDAAGSGTGSKATGVEYARARSVFVGNLHFDVQDEELIQVFSDASVDPQLEGAVTAVRVVRDRATNVGKGVAYVEVCMLFISALRSSSSHAFLGLPDETLVM